jgi:hypothetical protein
MTHSSRTCILATLAMAALPTGLGAQETLEQRVLRLERQNELLQQQLNALSLDVESIDLGGVVPPVGEAQRGVGQGAAKVYDVERGLSIGGYGEFLFQQQSGRRDLTDAQRAILYFGYRFDERWVFNSEIEIEHGTTSGGVGEVSLEFGYLDYLHSDALNLRAGMLLSPLGLVNELHEPTTYLTASRSQTETRIIPTTLRELGAGLYGDIGDFSYRLYGMTSLDGAGFSASGLRGGRQKGGKAEADDWSLVSRIDYIGVDGLVVGGSLSYGDTGQDGLDDTTPPNPIPDLTTTILEAHVDYRTGPWQLRALYAAARLQDAGAFDAVTSSRLASRMSGYYGEFGYDLLAHMLPESKAQLVPFCRYERIDTQQRMPAGVVAEPGQDDEILTFGIRYSPLPQIVVKLDYEDWDHDSDRLNLLFGYVF